MLSLIAALALTPPRAKSWDNANRHPRIMRNVPYIQHGMTVGRNPLQTMDIFWPMGRTRGLVVFVYGGGWHAPRSRSVDAVAKAFNDEGYICALVNHRLGPQDKFPAQMQDLKAALSYLLGRQDMPGIVLVGHSSGANLSMLCVTDPTYRATRFGATGVWAVIGLSTPLDLRPKPDHHGFGDALMSGHGADTFDRDPKVLERASPAAYPSTDGTPTLLVAGDRDMPGLADDARSFARSRRNVTVDIEPNCDHMGTVAGLVDPKSPIHRRVFQFIASASHRPTAK